MTQDLIFVLHLYEDPDSAYVNNFASSAIRYVLMPGDTHVHQVYVIYDQISPDLNLVNNFKFKIFVRAGQKESQNSVSILCSDQ
jgi:hypothetical protein